MNIYFYIIFYLWQINLFSTLNTAPKLNENSTLVNVWIAHLCPSLGDMLKYWGLSWSQAVGYDLDIGLYWHRLLLKIPLSDLSDLFIHFRAATLLQLCHMETQGWMSGEAGSPWHTAPHCHFLCAPSTSCSLWKEHLHHFASYWSPDISLFSHFREYDFNATNPCTCTFSPVFGKQPRNPATNFINMQKWGVCLLASMEGMGKTVRKNSSTLFCHILKQKFYLELFLYPQSNSTILMHLLLDTSLHTQPRKFRLVTFLDLKVVHPAESDTNVNMDCILHWV